MDKSASKHRPQPHRYIHDSFHHRFQWGTVHFGSCMDLHHMVPFILIVVQQLHFTTRLGFSRSVLLMSVVILLNKKLFDLLLSIVNQLVHCHQHHKTKQDRKHTLHSFNEEKKLVEPLSIILLNKLLASKVLEVPRLREFWDMRTVNMLRIVKMSVWTQITRVVRKHRSAKKAEHLNQAYMTWGLNWPILGLTVLNWGTIRKRNCITRLSWMTRNQFDDQECTDLCCI